MARISVDALVPFFFFFALNNFSFVMSQEEDYKSIKLGETHSLDLGKRGSLRLNLKCISSRKPELIRAKTLASRKVDRVFRKTTRSNLFRGAVFRSSMENVRNLGAKKNPPLSLLNLLENLPPLRPNRASIPSIVDDYKNLENKYTKVRSIGEYTAFWEEMELPPLMKYTRDRMLHLDAENVEIQKKASAIKRYRRQVSEELKQLKRERRALLRQKEINTGLILDLQGALSNGITFEQGKDTN